ncbi:phosphatidylserine decarboxylase [Candidatus Babeliales bacterium]|nr:phosphatidylserine decarboxylase [Candidatus Babeliales bacterium]MCF7899530.1 phosphatidylserine decarboxylase [Candidatus Babeliales bacterium]
MNRGMQVSEQKANCYYNLNNKIVCEKIEAENFLKFLYGNFFGKILRFFINKKYFSKICAVYQKSVFSKRKIKDFIKKHNIDMSQFQEPKNGYKSFNDFFIRKLKGSARLIDYDINTVISPADSKLFVIPDLSKNSEFFVKNKKFNLNKFFQDKNLSQEYQNGILLIFRLAPYDYHRFHFPIDSIPNKPKNINGLYDSVNLIAYKSGIQPLESNERILTVLKTEKFKDIIFVSVGALLVGKIILNYTPNIAYKKGDEMGYFEFGGSTIVLVFKKDTIKIKDKFLKNSANLLETEVLMGQAITE